MRPALASNYPRVGGRAIDYEAVKRNGYRDQGLVIVSVFDDRLNDWERQFLRNIARKLFGKNTSTGRDR